MDPEGIYLGSRIKVLQEDIKKVINKSGNHSLTIPILGDVKKDFISFKKIFFKLKRLIFKIFSSNYLKY